MADRTGAQEALLSMLDMFGTRHRIGPLDTQTVRLHPVYEAWCTNARHLFPEDQPGGTSEVPYVNDCSRCFPSSDASLGAASTTLNASCSHGTGAERSRAERLHELGLPLFDLPRGACGSGSRAERAEDHAMTAHIFEALTTAALAALAWRASTCTTKGKPDMDESLSDFQRAAVALLAEERPDLVTELSEAAVAAHKAGQMWLCDADGTVTRGIFHHGSDYPCTGSAHYGGQRIACGNPIHQRPAAHWYEPKGAA